MKRGKKEVAPIEIVNPDTREKVTLLLSKDCNEFLQELSNASQITNSRLCEMAIRRLRKEIAERLGIDLMAMKPEERWPNRKIFTMMSKFSDEAHGLWKEQKPKE